MARIAKIIYVFGIITLIFTMYNFVTYYPQLQRISHAISDQFILTTILWIGVGVVQFAFVSMYEDYQKFKFILETREKTRT